MKSSKAEAVTGLRLTPLTLAVTAALGASVSFPAARAQDVVGAAEEIIIVTASRRDATIRDLPMSVTAIAGDDLERQRLTSLTEVARWVPGLTVVEQGARGADTMAYRGLNVGSLNASEFLDNGSGGTVATYIGEIPLYLDLKTHDLERVEFLSGPQGTLYGAGTLGGAVRYIPHAPDLDEFSMNLRGDFFNVSESDDPGYEAAAVVNAPIVDNKLAFRGSFYYQDDPGFIDYPYLVREAGVSNPQPDFGDPAAVAANLMSVEDANSEQVTSSRLALLWQISDSFDATFNYYAQTWDAGARSANHRDSFGTGNYESGHRFLEPEERETSLFSIELVIDLGFAELTSATGLSTFDRFGQRDQTDFYLDQEWGYETFPAFAAYTRDVAAEDRLNQELRLVSTRMDSPSWIVGLFYNDYELDSSSREFTPGIPEFWAFSVPTGDLSYLQMNVDTLKEQALFGELGFGLTDRMELTVGGRYFEYDTTQHAQFDLPFFDFSETQDALGEDDGFLGKLSLAYEFNDRTTGYATLSEGFRIGGVNSVPPCPVPLPATPTACALPDEVLIEPDRTTNLELGTHSVLGGGRLQLDAAIYTIDWDDVQTLGTTQNGSLVITVNGGSARSRGLEFGLVAGGSGPWSMRTSYAFNETELTSDAPGLVDGVDALDGDRLAGTPEQQFAFELRHQRTLNRGWDLDISYGVTATSDVLTKVGMRNNGEVLGGYSVHAASISVSRNQWQATLYADNLTDKFAETSVRLDPSSIRSVGPNGFDVRRYFRNVLRPRTIGLELRYSIGG